MRRRPDKLPHFPKASDHPWRAMWHLLRHRKSIPKWAPDVTKVGDNHRQLPDGRWVHGSGGR